MISGGQTIDLFKLQKELAEANVDMAVSRTIDRVIDQISALRNDMNSQIHGLKDDMNSQIHGLKDDMNSFKSNMNAQIHELKGEMNTQIHELKDDMTSQIHELRHEVRDGFTSLKTRVTAVETKLGMVSEPRKEVRSHFIEYCFKASWLILAAVVSSLALLLIK
jgi:dynactin complex subunit